jgi:hypothetical protein
MPRMIIALALLLIPGCDQMVALCNAGGYGTPQECQDRWGSIPSE